MIVDAHMHWPVGKNTDTAAMLKVMDSLGIDRGLVCGLEVFHFDPASHWNDLLSKLCAPSGGRLVPLATVNPFEGPAAIAEARRCVEKLGVKGFKSHPWSQGYATLHPTMFDLCDVAAEYDVPIMFHDGTPSNCLPSQIGVLAGARPKAKLVLGHGGLLHFWEEALEATRRYENVYITLCGQHPWAMQAICDRLDPAKVFWGTDYVGPGTEDIVIYRKGLADLLKLSDAKRSAVMGDSAAKVFKLR